MAIIPSACFGTPFKPWSNIWLLTAARCDWDKKGKKLSWLNSIICNCDLHSSCSFWHLLWACSGLITIMKVEEIHLSLTLCLTTSAWLVLSQFLQVERRKNMEVHNSIVYSWSSTYDCKRARNYCCKSLQLLSISPGDQIWFYNIVCGSH